MFGFWLYTFNPLHTHTLFWFPNLYYNEREVFLPSVNLGIPQGLHNKQLAVFVYDQCKSIVIAGKSLYVGIHVVEIQFKLHTYYFGSLTDVMIRGRCTLMDEILLNSNSPPNSDSTSASYSSRAASKPTRGRNSSSTRDGGCERPVQYRVPSLPAGPS